MPLPLPPALHKPARAVARKLGLAKWTYTAVRALNGSPRPRPRRPASLDPLHVLVEVEYLDRGGLEEAVAQLVLGLDRTRIHPVVACIDRGGAVAERLKRQGIDVRIVSRSKDDYRALLEREHIDVVTSHYSRFGVPLLREQGIPNVHVLHNSYVWLNERGAARVAADFARMERFIAVSSSVAEYARRKFGLAPEVLEVVPNGIARPPDVEAGARARMRAELGVEGKHFLWLHAGTFEPRKGQLALVAAFQRLLPSHPDARLVCVGGTADAAYRLECETRASETNGRVKLLEHSTRMAELYAAADGFVLPSMMEGFSLATLEALAAGLPLVLTDVGGARDVLTPHGMGLLVRPWVEDPVEQCDQLQGAAVQAPEPLLEELTRAMARIMDEREAWAAQATARRKLVLEHYTLERMCRRYEAIFRSVAS